MNGYFKRELVDYLEYHRDPRNSVMHVFGIPFLFLGAVLPFSAWTIHIFGFEITAAAIAVAPIMICWLVLDTALGVGILVAAVLLIAVATIISNHSSTLGMWSITCVLIVVGLAAQAVGHHLFEGRRPALLDNPPHMLFGPMFLMAKLFIALGFRHDLAAIIQRIRNRRSATLRFIPGNARARRIRTHDSGTCHWRHRLHRTASGSDARGAGPRRCGCSICGCRDAACRTCSMCKDRCSIPAWWTTRWTASSRFITSPAFPACGRRARTIFIPSIAAARRSSSRPRASEASHGSCTARRNPFFSILRPRKGPSRIIPCCRPTTCRVHIRARNCLRKSWRRKPQRPVFRW